LRYCGPKEANEQFRRYFSTKGNAKEVRESLLRFEGLPPYLSAIAKKHGLGMFDGQVVEAYWLGNELLDGFTIDDLKAIVDEESTKTIAYLPELMPDVKKGDVVAIHWGFAPLVLTAKQEKNLRKYSGIVLRVYTEKCS